MIERQVDETGLVAVEFRVRTRNGYERVSVVGDFNGWEPAADRMDPDGDAFHARLHLRPGAAYRFRHLLDGVHWENDWDADGYVANAFGGQDSVIDLTAF